MDIWKACCVIYSLLTKIIPYNRSSNLSEYSSITSFILDKVDNEWRHFLEKGLENDLNLRWSADALLKHRLLEDVCGPLVIKEAT